MNRRSILAVALILLIGCTKPTSLSQAITDARAIVHGAELAVPAFASMLPPSAIAQINTDLAKADGLATTVTAIADAAGQASSLQGVLNLVSGVANVIAANLPQPPPPNVAQGIAEFQAVMTLVQAVSPIVAPFVGQKAGSAPVPVVFRSGMTAADARKALGAK